MLRGDVGELRFNDMGQKWVLGEGGTGTRIDGLSLPDYFGNYIDRNGAKGFLTIMSVAATTINRNERQNALTALRAVAMNGALAGDLGKATSTAAEIFLDACPKQVDIPQDSKRERAIRAEMVNLEDDWKSTEGNVESMKEEILHRINLVRDDEDQIQLITLAYLATILNGQADRELRRALLTELPLMVNLETGDTEQRSMWVPEMSEIKEALIEVQTTLGRVSGTTTEKQIGAEGQAKKDIGGYDDEPMVDLSLASKNESLGLGLTATVRRAWLPEGSVVVKEALGGKEEIIKREAVFMRKLEGIQGIPRLLGVVGHGKVGLVMEDCGLHSASIDVLNRDEVVWGRLSPTDRVIIFTNVIRVWNEALARGVLNGDVKAGNILLAVRETGQENLITIDRTLGMAVIDWGESVDTGELNGDERGLRLLRARGAWQLMARDLFVGIGTPKAISTLINELGVREIGEQDIYRATKQSFEETREAEAGLIRADYTLQTDDLVAILRKRR